MGDSPEKTHANWYDDDCARWYILFHPDRFTIHAGHIQLSPGPWYNAYCLGPSGITGRGFVVLTDNTLAA
jgi:hypothetical protein